MNEMIIEQMDLTDTIVHFIEALQDIHFLRSPFFKINHAFGHKASLNKYMKTEIIPCTHDNRIRLQTNSQRNPKAFMNSWGLLSYCMMTGSL